MPNILSKKTVIVTIVVTALVWAGYYFYQSQPENTSDVQEPRLVEDPTVNKIQGITAVDDLNDLVLQPSSGDFLITSFDESRIYVLSISDFSIRGELPLDYPHKMLLPDFSSSLYVTMGGGKLAKLSLDNFAIEATILVGSKPSEMAYDSSRGYLLVVNEYSDNISVVDAEQFKVIDTIPVGKRPVDVVLGFSGEFAYVANDRDGSLSIVSLDGLEVVGTVYGVGRPARVIANHPSREILVLDRYNGQIVRVDQTTNQVTGQIDSVNYPTDAALNPDNNLLYVASFTDNTVGVIDLKTYKMIESVRLGSAFDSEGGLNNVALTKDKKSLVVTNTNNGQVFLVSY